MIIRLSLWIVHKFGLYTLISLALLLLALGNVVMGLSGAVRGLDFWFLFTIAMMGVLVSWILACSSLSEKSASRIIPLLGFGLMWLQLSHITDTLILLLTLLILAIRHGLTAAPPHFAPIVRAFSRTLTQLFHQISLPLIRLYEWSWAFFSDQPKFDSLVNAMLWGLMVWLVATWASWLVRRRQLPLVAIVPSGTLLVISFAYTGGDLSALVILLVATLLLMVLVEQHLREHRWETHHVGFSTEIRTDIATMVIPIIFVLTVLAASAPSISVQGISQFTQRLIWGETPPIVAVSLGLKPLPKNPNDSTTLESAVKLGALPRHHLIGSGPELSKEVVMIVEIPKTTLNNPPHYYWRALTYDYYTGQGWSSGQSETSNYQANQAIELASLKGQQAVQQKVKIVKNFDRMIYVAGSLGNVDQNYARGSYNATLNHFTITEADAHSWVEIYFPQYGWIEFEPTAGRATLERPSEAESAAIPPYIPPAWWKKWVLWGLVVFGWVGKILLGGLILAGVVGFVWVVGDTLYLRLLSPSRTVIVIYHRLCRYQQWLSVSWKIGDTPYEVAQLLNAQITALAQKHYRNKLLPTIQAIDQLTDLYVQVSYGDHEPNRHSQTQAIRAWRQLQWRLWLAYFSSEH